ncbi:MAG: hypothetical protein C4529_01025 [Deltaproteobacteria bacterium]|nr:MAG: hypothetical protein C4529_01025 [Deltaproteobacteria bacterium]
MTARRLVVFSVFWLGLVLALPRTPEAHPNARFLRGDITVSTSWEGVIRLTGTVVIREDVTVTVDPGTEILVQPGEGTDIEVRGRLLVRGIPEKPVLFDTAGGCAAGPWGGIRFRPGSTGMFENVRIRCSAVGVTGEMSGVMKKGVSLEAGR